MAIIKAQNLIFKYSATAPAIKGVDIEINEGEFVAIIGHNGSGKSTLAKLFNGLLKPTSGEVVVDGLNTRDDATLFDVRKTVGVVFQNPDNQLVASIVEDDVAFGAENIGLPREEIAKRIDFALSTVGMLEFKNSTPSRLSGGQKQRIAIAGVLAVMPKVLVLDESTAMLDPVGRAEVMKVVSSLNKKEKMTVVTITHYMEEIVDADRVIVLNDGKVVLEGTPIEIFTRAEELERYGLTIPFSSKIAQELQKQGLLQGKMVIDNKTLGDELCKLFPKV